jgi:hypothetical protein
MIMIRANSLLLCIAFVAMAGPALAKKPAPPSPSPEPGGAAFDRSAASSSLSSVSLLPCKQTKGPSGDGHVVVTFAPSGEPQDVVVDRDPFKGTAVGRCIAGQYKRARVPKFSGPAVSVGKTFHMD